ncbi:protein of unknown function [Shewanella benthica]|uniref:Uncharacterized protein n=1 Tax=Shewanella benthica TaxID=43661 RepID=A0A330M6B0_9GAMM|nr:protein of unknown function [Shewanella benthica]
MGKEVIKAELESGDDGTLRLRLELQAKMNAALTVNDYG